MYPLVTYIIKLVLLCVGLIAVIQLMFKLIPKGNTRLMAVGITGIIGTLVIILFAWEYAKVASCNNMDELEAMLKNIAPCTGDRGLTAETLNASIKDAIESVAADHGTRTAPITRSVARSVKRSRKASDIYDQYIKDLDLIANKR